MNANELIEKMKDSRKDIINPDYKIGLNTLNEWIEDLQNLSNLPKSESEDEERYFITLDNGDIYLQRGESKTGSENPLSTQEKLIIQLYKKLEEYKDLSTFKSESDLLTNFMRWARTSDDFCSGDSTKKIISAYLHIPIKDLEDKEKPHDVHCECGKCKMLD